MGQIWPQVRSVLALIWVQYLFFFFFKQVAVLLLLADLYNLVARVLSSGSGPGYERLSFPLDLVPLKPCTAARMKPNPCCTKAERKADPLRLSPASVVADCFLVCSHHSGDVRAALAAV